MGNPRDPIRQWTERETALSQLAGEGWTIIGPFPKIGKSAFDSRRSFYGYALTRIVH
jgi:hypothetical protein